MTLSDQVNKQLAELNQALDAMEVSVRRVKPFLAARPSRVTPLASDPQIPHVEEWARLAEIQHQHEEEYSHTWMARNAHSDPCAICDLLLIALRTPANPRRWGEVYDGGQ